MRAARKEALRARRDPLLALAVAWTTASILFAGTALAANASRPVRDLLPRIETDAASTPPAEALEGHGPCGGEAGPSCRMVTQATQRRRAAVLAPGGTTTLEIDAQAGDEIRFEIARLKWRAPHLQVTATLRHPDGEVHATAKTPRPWEGWRTLRLPVRFDGTQTLEIRASGLAKSQPLAGVGIGAPRLVQAPSAKERARPNILLYLMDTLRADHTSPYGYTRATTPRLGKLAADGTVFSNASSTAPITRPSTASILTGRFPSETQARLARGLDNEVDTLAEALKAEGYVTHAFVANGNVFEPAYRFDQGFDRFETIRGVNLDNHAYSDEINEIALPHLDHHADEAFFLYVHAVDPHSPYDPPPSHRHRFTAADYDGPVTPEKTLNRELERHDIGQEDMDFILGLYDEDILYQDESFGRLLDGLASRGLLENTLVVVVSDHGDEFREHGRWEHGSRIYEHQTRVPFIMAGPGVRKTRVDQPVSLVDVLPTILGHIGATPPPKARGRDLSPLLRGDGTVRPAAIYSEEAANGFEWNALRQDGWKIIRRARWKDGDSDEKTSQYKLFHLEEDPSEQQDRAAQEPERTTRMREALLTLRSELRAQRTGGEAPIGEIDPRTRRQLEALGYLVE